MVHDGRLLLVLHAPPGPDPRVREGRFFWRDVAGRWTPDGSTPAQPGVGQLLTQFENNIADLQSAEDAADTAREYFDLLNRLNPLVRTTRNLQKALQEAREAEPNDRELLLWRDRADTLVRSAELLLADANNALDFAVAQRAEEEVEANRRVATASHRLNVMAAFFLPLATLAAVLGMNLKHGLEKWDIASAPWPTFGVLAVGVVFGALLALFITRKP
jgi:Mg2+ and Co2+ transporter CorA